MEKFIFNDYESIKSAIKNNQEHIFEAKQIDEIVTEPLNSEKFLIEDYIKLEVLQKSTKKHINLKTYIMYPDENKYSTPKGVMFMFHGMGDYSGHSANIAKSYCKVGLVSCAYDYRGQGKSEGINGNIESMDELLSDTEKFMQETESFLKNKYELKTEDKSNFTNNRFVSGLSMGGLVSYLITKNKTPDMFKAVIFYAPAFDTYVNCFLNGMSGFIKCIAPNLKLSKNDEYCKNKYYNKNKPKELENLTTKIRTAGELLDSIKPIKKERKNYSIPFVMIIAGIDKLCPPQSMVDFYHEAKSSDKEIWYFPSAWHAIYIEEEVKYILPKVEEYIEKKLSFS